MQIQRSVVSQLSALLVITALPAQALSTREYLEDVGNLSDELVGLVMVGGDFNGDGYGDLVVGASGTVTVHFGGPNQGALDEQALLSPSTNEVFFGFSVGNAGDFNADGYDDVIVGDPFEESPGEYSGAAHVFYGGPDMDGVADWTRNAYSAGDYLGWGVDGAGDMNGDGYDDIIIGQPRRGTTGRASVYYGGLPPNNIANIHIDGTVASTEFAKTVVGLGDFNGDGRADIAVGSPDNGFAEIHFGSPTGDSVGDRFFQAEYGTIHTIAGGDINGDGFADILIGSPDALQWGAVTIIYGTTEIAGGTDVLEGASGAGTHGFGYSIAVVGDVDGDGYQDFLVGGQDFDNGTISDAGRVDLFLGGPTLSTTSAKTFLGARPEDLLGHSVAGPGDMNGDGHVEIAFGAPRDDSGASDGGRAAVHSVFNYEILAPQDGTQLLAGRSATVRWRGADIADIDLSVDGGKSWSATLHGVGGSPLNEALIRVPDVVTDAALLRLTYTGLPSSSRNSRLSGTLRMVRPHQPPAVAFREQLAPFGQMAGDQYGGSVATAGDVNGDGFDDLIVGAPNADDAGMDSGSAFVLYGGPGADDVADLTFVGEADFDFFGRPVAGAGDVNGDGFDDLIVGASLNDAGGADAGRAYLYFGGPGADEVADLVVTGETAGDKFGTSVGPAGDLNADGYDEFFVGAPRYDSSGTDAGRAYVYFGGPIPDTTPDLLFTGETGDFLGAAVAPAGDVNGDGIDDLLVSAHFNDTAGSNAGVAYLHYGSLNPDNIADLTFVGEGPGDFFGSSLGAAGDVNGDGFDDVIVGADHNDEAAEDAGRAYVYLGGPTVDAKADLILTGEVAFDQFGNPATGAGDVNGDGFGDLLIGAYRSGAGGVFRGRVQVFYGGPGADNVADVTLSGEAPGDLFGKPAGAAGDVNGDGFDDIIVGAASNDAGGAGAGRAYLYDFNRYHVLSPGPSQTWNVGATESITWTGGEPADVWLSVDGGNSYTQLRDNVGGSAANSSSLTVPHQPTRFAKLKITPADPGLSGSAETDSLFTIEASIQLLGMRAAHHEGGGVLLNWETDPGPTQLRGYKLERSRASGEEWTVLASSLRETEYLDVSGSAGMRYRLTGINGLGEELLLGEVGLRVGTDLSAWPLPYRGGDLNLSFAIYGRLGATSGQATVTVHDTQGRRIRTIAKGTYEAGYQTVTWDGKSETGQVVPSGVYFVRTASAGQENQMRLVVVR